MTPAQLSDGELLETDRDCEERRGLQGEIDKLFAVMPEACKAFDRDLDGIDSGWFASLGSDQIKVELNVTVTAQGSTAREVLDELHARGVGTGLLATYAKAALCDHEGVVA